VCRAQNVVTGITESGVPESRIVLAGVGLGGTCAVHTATKHAVHELAGVVSIGGGCVAAHSLTSLALSIRLHRRPSSSSCVGAKGPPSLVLELRSVPNVSLKEARGHTT
jgi:dienelactone hydrolase